MFACKTNDCLCLGNNPRVLRRRQHSARSVFSHPARHLVPGPGSSQTGYKFGGARRTIRYGSVNCSFDKSCKNCGARHGNDLGWGVSVATG